MNARNTRTTRLKSGRSRAVRPVVEGLEGRVLLYAVTGGHFTYGSRITWSIVPDGTILAAYPSNLISTMNNRFGAAYLVRAAQDAFAIWENVANVNFAQVSDDGETSGSGNYQQGSPTIGDIRIGGFNQGSGTLATTIFPPPANGRSDSGDIFFNTSQPFQIGSTYDLESVMIHEVGHALGLDHSSDSGAAMYPGYNGVHQYLNSDDVAGIRSVWGPRQEDYITTNNANTIASHAANLTSFQNPQSQIGFSGLNVANTGETYWYKVTTPPNASYNLNVVVQSTNLSELSPLVQLYDANIHGLAQNGAASGVYGATVGVAINYATPNTTYYIRVSGSNAGPTGTGGYGLLVNMGYSPLPSFWPPNTAVSAQPDQPGAGGSNEGTGGSVGQLPAGNSGGANGQGDSHHKGKHTGSVSADPTTRIRMGAQAAQGDYFLVAPSPSTSATPSYSASLIQDVPVPLISIPTPALPIVPPTKRGAPSILIHQVHPVRLA